MSASRREFLKASTALAAAFGLRAVGEAAAAEETPSVIWLQAQGCTGCSISLLNSLTCGTAEDLLRETMHLQFHPTLMAAAGPNAVAAALAARRTGGYVLVVEGAIPTAAGGDYCYLWPGTTAWDGVRDFAARAKHVVAVGTCAAYGGIAASEPPHGINPTGKGCLRRSPRGVDHQRPRLPAAPGLDRRHDCQSVERQSIGHGFAWTSQGISSPRPSANGVPTTTATPRTVASKIAAAKAR